MRIYFLILLALFSFSSYSSQNTGYKNILKNYFSIRKSNTSTYYGAPRSITLLAGTSIYGETKDDEQDIFSSRVLGFSQRVKEFSTIGDLNLRIELHSVKLESQRSLRISVAPHFTLPDIRSGFPIYVGLGGGFGLFPRHILKKQPALSLNVQMLIGMRFIDVYKNVGLMVELNLKMHTPFQDMKLYMELLTNAGLVFSF